MAILLLLLGWTCTVVAGAFVGESKGKTAEGLCFAFLFGPVGLICAMLLEPTPLIAAKRELEIEYHKQSLQREAVPTARRVRGT